MHHPETLDGPDFLEALADNEAGDGRVINSAEFRRRSRQWKQDRLDLEQAKTDLASLRTRLARAAAQLSEAA